MDLSGVEWAVLSACDTGVGDWVAGEGVAGLRRAFQLAGARTVIMSLWAVGDRAAAQWMTELYRTAIRRWQSHAGGGQSGQSRAAPPRPGAKGQHPSGALGRVHRRRRLAVDPSLASRSTHRSNALRMPECGKDPRTTNRWQLP